MTFKAMICGISGLELTDEERRFFETENPFGYILFARNVDTVEQVRALTQSLRDVAGRSDLPILIDQEGGRVQRLRAPAFEEAPPADLIGQIALTNIDKAKRAAYLHALLIGSQLFQLGITVNCAPCLDLRIPGASEVIGDRSYGEDPKTVGFLGASAISGFRDAGVLPVIKHIPGHGRAMVDSHNDLPRLEESQDVLASSDFVPFTMCTKDAWGMTAHLVLQTIDPHYPVTQSKHCLQAVIRETIGFDGFLMTDDLSMNALSGSMQERTALSFEAGCDVVLHCNGNLTEMRHVAEATPSLSQAALRRVEATPLVSKRSSFDKAQASTELASLISMVTA